MTYVAISSVNIHAHQGGISMNSSIFNSPISSNILKQAVTDVINAVAIEEKVLFNILNLESDIIQKAKNNSVNLKEFVSLNESVNSII